jgi:hypothetical protein
MIRWGGITISTSRKDNTQLPPEVIVFMRFGGTFEMDPHRYITQTFILLEVLIAEGPFYLTLESMMMPIPSVKKVLPFVWMQRG